MLAFSCRFCVFQLVIGSDPSRVVKVYLSLSEPSGPRCTHCYKKSCGDIPASGYTEGRLGCGTCLGPPAGCDFLECIAQQSDLEARVWRGSELPLDQQGVTILGTPLGHPDFVSAQLQQKIQDNRILLERDRRAISLVVIATLCLGLGELHLACGAA